jgi:diaminopimelate epimerase
MTLSFYKYQGTGNDFIIIDNRDCEFHADETVIRNICDRRFGIGADGLLLLEPSEDADFRMVYFNSDGLESTFCGNGGRCIVELAHHLGIIPRKTRFVAKDGFHEAWVVAENLIRLKMQDVEIPVNHGDAVYLFTGSPHWVEFHQNVSSLPVRESGRKIREAFSKEGTNVNFVEEKNGCLFVRTYERGVEDETLSCGTGVTASALAAAGKGWKSPIEVETPGGKLQVEFTKNPDGSFSDVYLTGPTRFVFEGKVDVPALSVSSVS